MRHTPELTRRDMLLAGGKGLLSLALGSLGGMTAVGQTAKHMRGKLLVIWTDGGGPSNIDSFDPKGESKRIHPLFSSIRTSVPGLHITWPLAALAPFMHQVTLFRARYAHETEHERAMRHSMRATTKEKEEEASVGMMGMPKTKVTSTLYSRIAQEHSRSKVLFGQTGDVFPEPRYRQALGVPLYLETFYRNRLERFIPPVPGDNNPRRSDQRLLQETLEAAKGQRIPGPQVRAYEQYAAEAHDLLDRIPSGSVPLDPREVDDYCQGFPNSAGIGMLTMREYLRRDMADVCFLRLGNLCDIARGWDHHTDARQELAIMLPAFAHAFSRLLRDRTPDRGLLPANTTIVWDTEFGRTPKLDSFPGVEPGRDHFPWHSSIVVSDALHPGIVGKTDDDGSGVGGMGDGAVDNEAFAGILQDIVLAKRNEKLRKDLPKELFAA